MIKKLKFVDKMEKNDMKKRFQNLSLALLLIPAVGFCSEVNVDVTNTYKVVKQFGAYHDPIYKVDLFRESVTLQPTTNSAKVYNVLDGVVVYAKDENSSLGNVVIIKHPNDTHTIYSTLQSINQDLTIGLKIKKGFEIGNIENTFVFQVTKENKYLNPIEFIKEIWASPF